MTLDTEASSLAQPVTRGVPTRCPTPAAAARKFVAATVTAAATNYLARKGLVLDPLESTVFTSLITGVVTYFIPNA